MKKFLWSLLLILSMVSPSGLVIAGHGGDSFAGGLAGGMVGGLVSGAMTKDSGSSRRAEAEAREARMRAERAEQQTMYSRFQSRGTMTTILIISLFVLFFAVIGLFIYILKFKKDSK